MDIVVEISAPNLCAFCIEFSLDVQNMNACISLKMLYSARSEKWKYRNSELENI